ncbi:MAG: Uma2 family endonuclease [Kamptonema sp. SIO4C4]|nr:Uma2 family endonuclease [Kamptonema sp. SIO4C4]
MIAIPQFLSPQDYLEQEKQSPIKHEYIDGQVYAMAGASDAHVTIVLNLASELRSHLRGLGCRGYISDMKARINETRYYYPDLLVTCDPRDTETPYYKQYPTLIVEVLSDTTEAFDRGDKFLDYQTRDTLQEYVLINSRQQRVETFRRNNEGLWVMQVYTPEISPHFELRSIDYTGTFDLLYEDVVFEPREDNNGQSD